LDVQAWNWRGAEGVLTGGGTRLRMKVGEEPRGSPAEGHGLLAHPAAFFSSRSGASAEGAVGRKMEEGTPAMAELAIFLRTSLALPTE